MVGVTELGYLGIGVSDADAWKEYATEVVGMELRDDGEGDRFYLRMDAWHHRIVVHEDGSDDLVYAGWRVAGPHELDAMAQRLDEAGVPFKQASQEEAQERRVLGLLKLDDPGGNPTEVFYGPLVDTARPFHPGRPMHGRFLTGSEGLGHMILREDDVEAAFDFYSKIFGMRGSIEYRVKTPVGIGTPIFMHCNDRDHSIAFNVGPMAKRIDHLMIESTSIDDVGMTYDLVKQREIPIAVELGKHSNDQALTFYMANPSGWLWEYGWGARKAMAQQEYYSRDVWGHDQGASGYGMDVDFKND